MNQPQACRGGLIRRMLNEVTPFETLRAAMNLAGQGADNPSAWQTKI